MRAAGASVHDAVRETITRNRSLYDCVKMGIANYTALAERIRPAVERQTGAPANLNTIVVAIKRYADSFGGRGGAGGAAGQAGGAADGTLRGARLSLTDGVVGVTIAARDLDGGPLGIIGRIAEATDKYEFFSVADSFSLIVEDAAGARDVLEDVGGRGRLSRGLAKITITVPEGHTHSDIVSYVAELLHDGGIELANAFFGHDVVIVLLDERDAARAYDLLRPQS